MYKTEKTAIKHLRNGESFRTKNFDLFRNSKAVVIEAISYYAKELNSFDSNLHPFGTWPGSMCPIHFSAPELKEIFDGDSPEIIIETLSKFLLAEKLERELLLESSLGTQKKNGENIMRCTSISLSGIFDLESTEKARIAKNRSAIFLFHLIKWIYLQRYIGISFRFLFGSHHQPSPS